MAVSTEQVHELLNPHSIAVVGASDDSLWSQGFMRNLAFFAGDVHLVNPRRAVAFGRKTYPSLSAVPSGVDHAVVLVRASLVPSVLKEAAAAGIHSATVIASDLGESPGVGSDLAEEVRSIAKAHSIALVGSNCYGFNNYSGTYVSRYNIDVPSEPGAIGFSFQSGQLGGATADAASARGIHLRYLVSSGNELVVDSNDYLEYFLENDDIRVTGGSVERIADPERFERLALRAVDLGKPIVLLKPGRSDAASRIAVAHTGAITGSDAVADAFLEDLGVIRVDSVEELAETAGLLARRGWPAGRRAVFVGFSGGACELFADQAETTSISLEPYSSDLLDRLSAISGLPHSVIHNPFDLTVDAMSRYPEIVDVIAASGEYDIVVSQGAPKRSFEAAAGMDVADARRERNTLALQRACDEHGIFGLFHETSDHQPGIGVFSRTSPNGSFFALGRNGVLALSNSVDYGLRRVELASDRSDITIPVVERENLPESFEAGAGSLNEVDSKALLRAYGIPVSEDIHVTTAQDAVIAARQIGYPVVMKVVAPELAHKSDVGGVALNIRDDGETESAFATMLATVAKNAPNAYIQGVIVSRFTQGGTEFIAGINNDPRLGPMVVAGLGGVLVEIFKDAVLVRPPFGKDRALRAIRSLQCAPLLDGVRGGAPLDEDAFADVLCRLGRLALEQRRVLAELDVNPLLVLPRGQGVLAVDALAVTTN